MWLSPFFKGLGLKYPIFQGGMAYAADGKLATAVSNTGGLGIIVAGNPGSHVAEFGEVGIKLVPVVRSVALTRMMERVGAAAVIAEEMKSDDHNCNYKKAVLKANVTSTVVTGEFVGHPSRVLKNKMIKKYIELEKKEALLFDKLEKFGSGSLRHAVIDGYLETGSFMSGEISGLVKKEQPTAEIWQEVYEQANSLLDSVH